MKRREILATASAVCSGFIAGCVTGDESAIDDRNGSQSDDDEQRLISGEETADSGSNTNDSTKNTDYEEVDSTTDDTKSRNESPAGLEVTKEGIETTGTECMTAIISDGMPDDDTEKEPPQDEPIDIWSIDGKTVVIRNSRRAPNPCHEAVLTDSELQETQLRVVVDLKRTDEMCRDCIGTIEYEARIGVTDVDAIEDVDVVHPE